MSWDIFVQDVPGAAKVVGDIADDFEPRPLDSRAEVIRRILEVIPDAEFSDPSWGSVEGPGFSIDGIFDLKSAGDSLKKWRTYRDQLLAKRDAG